jgi:hypothetical protein
VNLRPEIIKIRPDYNYRDMTSETTKAHIAWLESVIKTEGVKVPIHVIYSNGEATLEAGQCRLTAAQNLRKKGWDGFIPVVAVKGDEAKRLGESLLDNTGLAPTLMEVGKALQRMIDLGYTEEEAARYVPPSITTDPTKALRMAKKALTLNAAPLVVKEAVKAGKITEGLAVSVTRKAPLEAAKIVEEEVQKAAAKGAGKAKRPKGVGKAGIAKEAVEKKHRSLEKIGDQMAAEIRLVPCDFDKLEELAEEWIKARV